MQTPTQLRAKIAGCKAAIIQLEASLTKLHTETDGEMSRVDVLWEKHLTRSLQNQKDRADLLEYRLKLADAAQHTLALSEAQEKGPSPKGKGPKD